MNNYDGSVKIDSKLDLEGLKKALGELKQVISDAVSGIKPKLEEIDEAAKNAGQEAASGARKAKEGFDELEDGLSDTAAAAQDAGRAIADGTKTAGESFSDLEAKLTETNAKIQEQRKVVSELKKELAAAKFSNIGVENAEKKLASAKNELKRLYDEAGKVYEQLDTMSDGMDSTAESAEGMAAGVKDAATQTKDLGEQVDKTGDTLGQMGDKSEKAGNGAESAGKKLKQTGEDAKGSAEKIGTMTVALGNLIARGIEKLITSLAKLVDSTREARTGMAKLQVSAEEAGESMGHVEESLRALQGVTGNGKDNIEALANLLQADFKGETLDEVVEALAGAVVRFPETLKIESLADSLQETIATGKGVGQFAELLERCGIDIDKFNERMERAGSIATRQNIVMQTLAQTGLAESYEAFEKNNGVLVNSNQAVYDYEQAMNTLAQTLEPAKFAVLETVSDFVKENGETLEAWGKIITVVISTVAYLLESLASMPPSVLIVISSIIMAVTIMTKMSKAIDAVSGGLEGLSKVLSPANYQLMQTAVIVMMVVAAVSLLVYLLVALNEGSERAGATMEAFAKRSQDATNTAASSANAKKAQNGFARGTASAPKGRFLVGESGPEEIELRGGERIYSATQSRARRALATGGGSGGVVNNYYNLDVSKVRSMAQVVELAESAQQYNRKYGR